MELNKTVCYLGDDDVSRAAAYLCGIMTRCNIDFDRIDSPEKPSGNFQKQAYSLYVVSDYESAKFNPGDMEHICARVREDGAGLLMLGGWESYYGRAYPEKKSSYDKSPLADILPVVMESEDDRRNYSSPVLLRPTTNHEIIEGLPWETAPGVGGFNQFEAKEGAKVLLEGYRTQISWRDLSATPNKPLNNDDVQLTLLEKRPFLVVDEAGKGRVAAFASDVAPHWIGGMVDWGTERVHVDMPRFGGDVFVEVGAWYAKFFAQILKWTGRF